MAVSVGYSVSDLKKALGAKRLGRFDALPGWSISGRAILAMTFRRYSVVEYHMADAGNGYVFQDKGFLDD